MHAYIYICIYTCVNMCMCVCVLMCMWLGTAGPTWGVIFEGSRLKARSSLLPRFGEKGRSNFELWAL